MAVIMSGHVPFNGIVYTTAMHHSLPALSDQAASVQVITIMPAIY